MDQEFRILNHDEVQSLLDHPKCKDIARQLGHLDYEVVYNKHLGGPGICTPFRKSHHLSNHIKKDWEELLDGYQTVLEKAYTLEGLWSLRFWTERAYRPYVLRYLHEEQRYQPEQFDIGGWWDLLIDLWEDSEAIHDEKESDFAYLFNILPTTKRLTKLLPKGKFTIYRGGHPAGDSWTLNRDKAKWFANMRVLDKEYVGKVFEKTITRNDALFYTNGREEDEVLLKTILTK